MAEAVGTSDPNYRYSINQYFGDGAKLLWQISFAGGYLDRSHIKARYYPEGGVADPINFSWVDASTVKIEPAVPAGARFIIYRDTPKDKPLAQFKDGAFVTEQNLDRNAIQAVFIAAEAQDTTTLSIKGDKGEKGDPGRSSVRAFVGVTGSNADDQAQALRRIYDDPQVTAPYFPAGDYRIGSDLTITDPTTFDKNAVIRVGAGAVLTISADINAGQYQVFSIEPGGNVRFTSGAVNQIIPDWFGANLWYGSSNTIYGKRTGENLLRADSPTTSNYMCAFGYRVIQQMRIGQEGAFFGTFAGSALIDGTFQTGLGYAALRGKETFEGSGTFRPISGDTNTGVGCGALQDGVILVRNTAVGAFAGKEYETASDNTLLGTFACRVGKFGEKNVLLGANAGYNLGETGAPADTQLNVGVGYAALGNPANKKGSYNTCLGGFSGYTLTTGQMNTFCGYNTGPLSDAEGFIVNAICIGFSARARKSNSITIGNGLINAEDRTLIGSSAHQVDTTLGPRKLVIGDTAPMYVWSIDGEANGTVAAPVGSLAGSKNGKLYFKAGGDSTDTGWREVAFV